MSASIVLNDLKKKNACQKIFLQLYKRWKIGDDGKKSDGHISLKDYLTCKNIWDKFDVKDMGDYHDYYFKKMYCYQLIFVKSLLTRASDFTGFILIIILVLLE